MDYRSSKKVKKGFFEANLKYKLLYYEKLTAAFLISFLMMNIFALDKTVSLNSGYEMPVLGLGTWTLTGETCEKALYAALKDGYHLIDTAKYYGNEKEVGNAIAKAVVLQFPEVQFFSYSGKLFHLGF